MERTGTRRQSERQLELTDRQVAVLRLIEQGYSNLEIAERLGMTLDGAKFHVSEILAKLGVSSREEAVAAWRDGRRRMPWAWILLGLGASAIGGVVLFILALARDASAPDHAAPVGDPPTAALVAQGVTCPPPRTPTPTLPPNVTVTPEPISDGPGAVRFNGQWYSYSFSVGAWPEIPPHLVGARYGEICYASVRGNRPAPGDQPRDGDSGGLQEGMQVFAVIGYSPKFRLALAVPNGGWLLLEPIAVDGARFGNDYLDLEDKVAAIEVLLPTDSPDPLPVARVDDPADVEEMVRWVLESPVGPSDPGPPYPMDWITLEFEMTDGTRVVRSYSPSLGRVWPNIQTPVEFQREVARLLAAGP